MMLDPIEPPEDCFTPAEVRRWITPRAGDPRAAFVLDLLQGDAHDFWRWQMRRQHAIAGEHRLWREWEMQRNNHDGFVEADAAYRTALTRAQRAATLLGVELPDRLPHDAQELARAMG